MTNEEMRAAVEKFNSTARPDITNDEFARENDILGFAEEIVNYVLAELRENREDWYDQFQQLTAPEQAMLFRALADGFNDSVDN
jgi:hypothetical protein